MCLYIWYVSLKLNEEKNRSWNEWLTFPIKYADLPASAQCAITVWDTIGPRKVVPVGGTTLRLFGKQ